MIEQQGPASPPQLCACGHPDLRIRHGRLWCGPVPQRLGEAIAKVVS